MTSRKKVGLVLGSGSSRGWAHIGAIEALEEAQIPIDFIVGCSVGSYVGALYACGSLASLKEFVLRMNGKKVFSYFDVVFPRSGLLDGTRKVKELFSMHTEVEQFEDLRLPVSMVATDLKRGQQGGPGHRQYHESPPGHHVHPRTVCAGPGQRTLAR